MGVRRTQPNKLEVGWEGGGEGQGTGSEPIGRALQEGHFAELHHRRARLILHAWHPLQQLLGLALGIPQFLLPLHQLGVTLWGSTWLRAELPPVALVPHGGSGHPPPQEGPQHTHIALQHKLLAATDAEQDALALLHLSLLH